jgi:hypothetical protein
MAYLEYSAPDDAAVFDEARWHEWMPALGRTVTVDDIRFQRDNLEPADFIRAFGNRVTTALNSVFPAEWVADAWAVLAPVQDIVLGVDVNDTPAGATVAAASLVEGEPAVRILGWEEGSPAWVPGKVAGVARDRDVAAVSVDFGGPARAIKTELEAACEAVNVPVVDRRPRDVAADTSRFYDGLRGGSLRLERMTALEDAINGAYRKNVGDLWFPSRRRMTKDASPLIAAILAAGLAVELDVRPVTRPDIVILG